MKKLKIIGIVGAGICISLLCVPGIILQIYTTNNKPETFEDWQNDEATGIIDDSMSVHDVEEDIILDKSTVKIYHSNDESIVLNEMDLSDLDDLKNYNETKNIPIVLKNNNIENFDLILANDIKNSNYKMSTDDNGFFKICIDDNSYQATIIQLTDSYNYNVNYSEYSNFNEIIDQLETKLKSGMEWVDTLDFDVKDSDEYREWLLSHDLKSFEHFDLMSDNEILTALNNFGIDISEVSTDSLSLDNNYGVQGLSNYIDDKQFEHNVNRIFIKNDEDGFGGTFLIYEKININSEYSHNSVRITKKGN